MKLGIIGWRGMVGQVLMDRMIYENDFSHFETFLFSTSEKGASHPYLFCKNIKPTLLDAYDFNELKKMDILLTCQGGEYTQKIYTNLRNEGFRGYWIDAASTLRMNEQSVIVLDPLNLEKIKEALAEGKKDYIGGNCTVSLLLMALGGLFKTNLIEWITSMTYQAASGGGAKHIEELLLQMKFLTAENFQQDLNLSTQILELEKKVTNLMSAPLFPQENFKETLACNLLPWIDNEVLNGQSREEWKAMAEANKILQGEKIIPIDGTCVRISTLRCHAQALTIKLKKDIPLNEIEKILSDHNPWVKIIKNNKSDSLKYLTPKYVSGKLEIALGRLRKMSLGNEYLNAFTVGDQLLWGAAEPLRRMLHIVREHEIE